MAFFAAGDQVGDWEIVRRIGVGGMGVVYAARHAVIGKRAAIKVVHTHFRERRTIVDRFVQEARVVNLIAHPSIVDIFQLGWLDDGRVYLVMEFLMGRSLTRRRKDGPISTSESIALLSQLCCPLAGAHAHGVVHRDLKPDNIFITEGGLAPRVKLLDWGLCALLSDEERSIREATRVGTPRYIAPEQAWGNPVDERADIYSLGVVAYELILGRAPFESDDVEALAHMHAFDPPPPPRALWPEIPRDLESLLISMLEKDPADRPSLGAVQATLLALGGTLPDRSSPLSDLLAS
ncbi:MAG TPA: serine/threonine-protein kinase [Kofleriaceae bacterium]|nr:serine/threonine-protein kinase [Kofleriaceae bacterium]